MADGDVHAAITSNTGRAGAGFDGVDDYLNTDDALPLISSDTKGTWAAWIKPTDGQGAIHEIIVVGDTDANECMRFEKGTNGKVKIVCIIGGGVKFVLETDAEVFNNRANDWVHVAVTQNGTAPILYINGIAVAQTATTTTDLTVWITDMSGADNMRMGCRNYNAGGNTLFFYGAISDVRIYNTDLSATEMLDLYKGGYQKTDSLVVHYTLDDPIGPELYTVTNATSLYNEATNTTGWTNVGLTTFVSSAVQQHDGAASIHCLANSASDRMYESIPTTIGKKYRASVWGYKAAGDNTILKFGTADNNDSYGTTTLLNIGQWRQLTKDFTATGTAFVVTAVEGGATNNADCYIDSLSLREITKTAPEYTTVGATYGIYDGAVAEAVDAQRVLTSAAGTFMIAEGMDGQVITTGTVET